MDGVATLVSDYLKENTTKVGEGKEGDEYTIIQLDHLKVPIRDLLETKEYILLNNLDLVEGGPWTWDRSIDLMTE